MENLKGGKFCLLRCKNVNPFKVNERFEIMGFITNICKNKKQLEIENYSQFSMYGSFMCLVRGNLSKSLELIREY